MFLRQSKCHYIDGGCLSSPRWVSLLVAEVYYPDTYLPSASNNQRRPPSMNSQTQGMHRNPDDPPPVQDFQNFQQYLQKRTTQSVGGDNNASSSQGSNTIPKKKSHCDGIDELGCFQVLTSSIQI